MKPLDEALRTKLIPALTGRPPPNNLECMLFALPARLGGLGIPIPSEQARREYHASKLITSALHDHILSQDEEYGHNIITEQSQSKNQVKKQYQVVHLPVN